MKITQEVRDFAAKQNAGAETFLAATATAHFEPVQGLPSTPHNAAEAEAGMQEMSKVYNETGRELYIGAGDRERLRGLNQT